MIKAALFAGALAAAIIVLLFLANRARSAPATNIITALEQHHRLPRGLLKRVCRAETRCRMVVALGRGKGGLGADVGPWQIHVPDSNSPAGQRAVRYLMDRTVNAAVAAKLLAASRAKCERLGNPGRCLKCPFLFYNYHSETWCRKVMGGAGDS